MAARTVCGEVGMIECCRYPRVGGVTVGTGVAAVDMVGGLTRRRHSIMTSEATALYLGVIDSSDRHPSRVAMTGLTHIGGLNMGRILAGSR